MFLDVYFTNVILLYSKRWHWVRLSSPWTSQEDTNFINRVSKTKTHLNLLLEKQQIYRLFLGKSTYGIEEYFATGILVFDW